MPHMCAIRAHPPKNSTAPLAVTARAAPEDTMILSIPPSFLGNHVHVAIRITMQRGDKIGFPGISGTLVIAGPNGIAVQTADQTLFGPPGVTWVPASDVIAVTMASSVQLATIQDMGQ